MLQGRGSNQHNRLYLYLSRRHPGHCRYPRHPRHAWNAPCSNSNRGWNFVSRDGLPPRDRGPPGNRVAHASAAGTAGTSGTAAGEGKNISSPLSWELRSAILMVIAAHFEPTVAGATPTNDEGSCIVLHFFTRRPFFSACLDTISVVRCSDKSPYKTPKSSFFLQSASSSLRVLHGLGFIACYHTQ